MSDHVGQWQSHLQLLRTGNMQISTNSAETPTDPCERCSSSLIHNMCCELISSKEDT